MVVFTDSNTVSHIVCCQHHVSPIKSLQVCSCQYHLTFLWTNLVFFLKVMLRFCLTASWMEEIANFVFIVKELFARNVALFIVSSDLSCEWSMYHCSRKLF